MRKLWPVTLILLLAAACGELPGTSPAHGPTAGAPRPSAPMPPTDTPIPYPLPPTVPYWLTPEAQPTAMAGPTPIVLGAEWAPESEREVYVSTTVVVAPVGDGPGEIGYWEAPEAGRVWADRFTVDTNGNIYILDQVNHRVARFGPDGQFAANTPYDPGWDAIELAADETGRVYLLRRGDGVDILDPDGTPLQEYSKPVGMYGVRGIRVDEQGMLWIVGEATYPEAPMIEGEPYPWVTIPLGKAGLVLDEGQQRMMAAPGYALFGGGIIIDYALTASGPAFLYDFHGRRIYQHSVQQGVMGIDLWGDFYLAERNPVGGNEATFIKKCNTQGKSVTMFGPLESERPRDDNVASEILIDGKGAVYVLVWGWEAKDAYRVIRWQRK